MENIKLHFADGTPVSWCLFCGAKVGEKSERTDRRVVAIYYCPRCSSNYCDQCSYDKTVKGEKLRFCLRCDTQLETVIK
jgi:hypothetical protein